MEVLHERKVKEEVIVALQVDLEHADVPEKDRALLRLAERLTVAPGEAADAVKAALAAGWTEREVADAILFTGAYNMYVRIAVGFGLPADHEHPVPPDATIPMKRCESPKKP